ncbi:hypothetical protein AJ80_05525 [Polytolypa hystricis UAMH7299]|uniref:Uncharacterized protein n=1 Tax=Polytolypa hystricis (strain UAMH7299) TaxID=1447883 RepID=A0A2B7Y3V5_POLH7|nr:hypothetical protein AJ80_05525 [Polytolypa hystricis UAMH7299]
MTRPAPPKLLEEIRGSDSPAARIAALRVVKNEIIGHDQRKEAWVGWGIVPLLARILSSRRGAGKKSVVRETNGDASLSGWKDNRLEEEETCLQTIIIVSSLVQGGPAYISPIVAGGILPLLFSILSSPNCHPSLVLAVLETLNAIADRLPLSPQQTVHEAKQLSSLIFSREHIGTFCRILDHTSPAPTIQSSIALAANLIAKTCKDEVHKATVAESGVLDVLALRLATFVVAQGFVLPGAEACTSDPGGLGALPPAAPANASLAPILRSIAVVIKNSKSRSQHFLSSPAMVTVFPKKPLEISPVIKSAPWGKPYFPAHSTLRQNTANPIDSILPSVPTAQTKGSANFPPLGGQGSYSRQGQFFAPPLAFSDTPKSDEEESAVVSWLLHVARSASGWTRLMAARVATILFRLGLAKSNRVPMFGFLLVPLLVRMFDKDYEAPGDGDSYEEGLISTSLRIKEEAPAVLASLVMDSRELQQYAMEGGAVKKLAQMIRESFNPISDNSKPVWNPEKTASSDDAQSPDTPAELRLGPPGFAPLAVHKTRYREGILRALAALALFNDRYRKDIFEAGVVPYIIDSMKPYEQESANAQIGSKKSGLEGNPIPTLLAACAAARSLTRSVTGLRTSLIDAGVAAPVFNLVKFRDTEVQIAATSVVCNLAMDFSPMKDAIIGANMIPTLCEHAHSSNMRLRLESIWSLKHITYNSTNDIKMKIVEFLEPGWLKQIISQDPTDSSLRRKTEEDLSGVGSIGMGTPNSAGEQVDLLNPVEDGNEPDSQEEDLRMVDTIMPPKPSIDTYVADNARRRKLALNGDLDHTKQARRDDIQVQEQALDLIRNLICGPGASEMIDFVFQELGQTDLLNILADKLRPKPLTSFSRKESVTPKSLNMPPEILTAVTYILIHLAAGLSRHRHILILHRDLLKSMMPLFNHATNQVRINCLWVVINLTYEDDQSDHNSCRDRATKLKSLGVMERLTSLEDDSEPDVRERTKTALHLMKSLLGS